jgi:hypothetical protein
MADYQLTNHPDVILRTADNAWIPCDPANVDYQAYLAWLDGGNTPDPAPVIPNPSIISASAFLERFTSDEQIAIQTAANSTPAIALGLTMGLASGSINLLSPVVQNWMQGLVTTGCLTQNRMDTILTP